MEFYTWMQIYTNETSTCLKDHKGCGIMDLIHKTCDISNNLYTLPSTHKDILVPTAAALLKECSASANNQILFIQLVVPRFF
jgi:hypothetical protein